MCFNRILPILFLQISYLYTFTIAQYPPLIKDQKEIRASHNPGVFVRYKNPSSAICQTTNPNQRQYTGYIHLPPKTLVPVQQDYPINTFFWFVEARDNPENAPLTIWLNGGPGSSSMIGMFSETGPCEAVEGSRESITTVPRDFSWDRSSNMLFIDQPNQVGFSYDTLTNGTLPLLDPNGRFIPHTIAPDHYAIYQDYGLTGEQFLEYFPEVSRSVALLNGTFSSGDGRFTTNTTEVAAMAAWHFLQAWLANFPQYNPNNTGINLFAESYGGKYGPKFFAFFEEQNELRDQGRLSKNDTVELHLESLGIINGCVDMDVQTPYYPIYANSNPYGIQVINDTQRDAALDTFYKLGGCKDMIAECRYLKSGSDPEGLGDVDWVNRACRAADKHCNSIRDFWMKSGKSPYDLTRTDSDSFPPYFYLEYLNNATVQQAIGTPVNYTQTSSYVYRVFDSTGDPIRGGETESLAYLLNKGVRVALLYGDRDYICNYMGGEAVSLAIDYPGGTAFKAAGYEDIRVNDSYVGGQVRQHGNFSFTRVFQAGHLVPAYQPETAYVLFDRIIHGKSLATGSDIVTSGVNIYSSTGPANSTVRLKAPKAPKPSCFVRDSETCTLDQLKEIGGGLGITINGVLYKSSGEYEGPGGRPPGSSDSQGNQRRIQDADSGDSNTAATAVAHGSVLALALALGAVLCVL